MGSEKVLIQLERKIKGKMMCIRDGTLTPANSEIGVLFKILKAKDEALHDELINEYKTILKTLLK